MGKALSQSVRQRNMFTWKIDPLKLRPIVNGLSSNLQVQSLSQFGTEDFFFAISTIKEYL